MSKLSVFAASAALAMTGIAADTGAARVVPSGAHAAACARGGSAMLVRVSGFKVRAGLLRVQSYDDPATFFEKGRYASRIEVPVPAAGPAEVCVPVAHAGIYAISVRHDANGSGKTDRTDGGGMSGNPSVSVIDLMFKRKPSPSEVAVQVRAGIVAVPIVLNYLQGATFAPIKTASR